MENRSIKYRTWYGGKMHFWGFSQDERTLVFVPPVSLLGPQMQFTNLKDKNGKEIYEGDVLALWNNGYPEDTPAVGYRLVVDVPDIYNRNDIQYCEVIGNIYETPELLPPQGRLNN